MSHCGSSVGEMHAVSVDAFAANVNQADMSHGGTSSKEGPHNRDDFESIKFTVILGFVQFFILRRWMIYTAMMSLKELRCCTLSCMMPHGQMHNRVQIEKFPKILSGAFC